MITEDLERLCVLKKDLRTETKKFRESVKPMKDEIALLEASIIDEVLKTGKTVQVGNIRAEYKPTVVIRMRKEAGNE